MIDHVNNLKFQYLVELSKQGARCGEYDRRIRERLLAEDVTFGSQPIPFLLMPHFLSPRQRRILVAVVERLSTVLNKFIDTYLAEPRYKELLHIDDVRDELFRIDPGFARPLTICRLDAFLSGYDLKFLEFNCDSPAGIGYTDVLYRALHETLDLPDVHYRFEEGYDDMTPKLLEGLLDVYAEFRANHAEGSSFPEKPTMAILDLKGVATSGEFKIIKRYVDGQGIKAIVGDPRDLKMGAGGWPELNGERIHLIYRRIVMGDVLKHMGELSTFIGALKAKRVCMANPFRAILAGNKKVMAMLLNHEWQEKALTAEERETIRHTIPWTRVLKRGKVTYAAWRVSLPEFVSDNRERLVLKPAAGYGGKDVYLGCETTQEKWDEIIAANIDDEEYVVQEFIPIPQEMFPVMEMGTLQMKLKKFNINPFALNGKFGGMITRISDASVINVTEGGGLLPSVVGFIKENIFSSSPLLRAEDFPTPNFAPPAGSK
jgi:glutathionylspermidine synthase